MGIFYEVQGSVKVKDNETTRALLAAFEDSIGEIDFELVEEEGVFTIEVNGGMHCSYGSAEEVDTALKAFGPHLAGEVGYFDTTCENNEHSDLWVGPEDAVAKAIRAALVNEAREAIRKLTVEEWEDLYEEVTSPHFWV